MNKKHYVQPAVRCLRLQQRPELMAASTSSAEFSGASISSGWTDSGGSPWSGSGSSTASGSMFGSGWTDSGSSPWE